MIRQLLVMTFVGGMLWFPTINAKTVSFLIGGSQPGSCVAEPRILTYPTVDTTEILHQDMFRYVQCNFSLTENMNTSTITVAPRISVVTTEKHGIILGDVYINQ